MIPHDTAAAILYGELLQGMAEVGFSEEFLISLKDTMALCLNSFLADSDWYDKALRSMGYPDIANEYQQINDAVKDYCRNLYAQGVFECDLIKDKIWTMIPEKYLKIIETMNKTL